MFPGDHLHFGYWHEKDSGRPFLEAQDALFERLLEYLPEPPASILDVGCGLGYSSYLLSRKGYYVHAISPSLEMIAYAIKYYNDSNISYENCGFLDEESRSFQKKKFDVIWFQESLQYLHPLVRVLQKARELLNPKGILVLCDEVVQDETILPETMIHPLKSILRLMAETGFRVDRFELIGDRVKQTCDEIISMFEANRVRLSQLLGGGDEMLRRIDHYEKGWRSQLSWYTNGKTNYFTMKARKDEIRVRSYRKGDEDRILPLFRQAFGVNRSSEHWNWKFRQDPFGALNIAVGETDDGQIVSHFCGYPVPFYTDHLSNSKFIVFQAGDTMTHPAFRGKGIGKNNLLSRTAHYFYDTFCQGVIPFFYGFNRGIIRKLGEMFLGFEYLEPIPYHVLNYNQYGKVSFWKKAVQRIYGFSIDKVDRITDEYDLFFYDQAKNYGFLVERNAQYLKWRYLDCPDGVHRIYALRRWGKLVGWSVFRRRGDVLLWGDAFFDSKGVAGLGFFLAEVIRCENRVASCAGMVAGKREISNPGEMKPILRIEGWFSLTPAWWTEALGKIGFVIEKEPNDLAPCVRRFSGAFDPQTLGSRWYYTWGDSDLF